MPLPIDGISCRPEEIGVVVTQSKQAKILSMPIPIDGISCSSEEEIGIVSNRLTYEEEIGNPK